MDTKWKNSIIVSLVVVLFTFGLSGLITNLYYGSYYLKRDYFQTWEFQYELERFIDTLNMFELNVVSEELSKQKITVKQKEIHEHRYRYGDLSTQLDNIRLQYEQRIAEALQSNAELAEFYQKERDLKLDDITQNFLSEDHIKAKIIKEKEAQLEAYYRAQEQYRGEFIRYSGVFQYYLRNINTGDIYTNVPLEDGKPTEETFSKANMIFVEKYPSLGRDYITGTRKHILWGYGHDDIESIISHQSSGVYEGYIGLPNSAIDSHTLLANYQTFKKQQIAFLLYIAASIIALIIVYFINRRFPIYRLLHVEKIRYYYYKIPIDIKLVVVGLSVIVTFALLSRNLLVLINHPYMGMQDFTHHILLTSLFVAITSLQVLFLKERYIDEQHLPADWREAFICRIYETLKKAFSDWRIGTQLLVLLLFVFFLGIIFSIIAFEEPGALLLFIPVVLVIGLPLIYLILKQVGLFNQIVNTTKELAAGTMGDDLPVKGTSPVAVLAGNINILKQGVKLSMKEQAKSERLKTELITNVSHDLRTPLTSIITYTELLKKQGLAEEDRSSYIEIIDRKSQRLKVLIDDLFEASKMASGNIELKKDKVNLFELLQQALAESDERIKESSLDFRVEKPEHAIHVVVDGQKLWRVFDNLIGNILKYSLENTRVYIAMKVMNKSVIITFKNVSRYELSDNVDELFERFKRGDTSRHTEGSGLGLAIAKSIVDLHNGSLDIEVDGDLFKVTVTLDAL